MVSHEIFHECRVLDERFHQINRGVLGYRIRLKASGCLNTKIERATISSYRRKGFSAQFSGSILRVMRQIGQKVLPIHFRKAIPYFFASVAEKSETALFAAISHYRQLAFALLRNSTNYCESRLPVFALNNYRSTFSQVLMVALQQTAGKQARQRPQPAWLSVARTARSKRLPRQSSTVPESPLVTFT